MKKIVEKYAKFGKLENRHKTGRPKLLNETVIRSIVRSVKKNPTESAVKIAESISESSNRNVSASTIRRALHANGINGRAPRKNRTSPKLIKKDAWILQTNIRIRTFRSGKT